MPLPRRLRILAVALALEAAIAPPRVGYADETNATNVLAARKHFEKARAFYAQGAYRDAISELEAAHALDPNAKDLVFNLGVVHEKLGDMEDALKWFKQYTMMDLTAQERDRADAYIKRLEGAKKEVEEKQNAPQPPQSPQQEVAPPGSEGAAPAARTWPPSTGGAAVRGFYAPPSPSFGRVDALTLGAAGLSVAGLGFGIVFGIKALSDRPSSTPTTSGTFSYAQLMSAFDQAHKEGAFADISFAVAFVAGAATAYLYFGRPRTPAGVSTGSTTVSASPVPGGGALLVKGLF